MFEKFRLTLLKERVSLKRLHKIVLTISSQGNYYILRNDIKWRSMITLMWYDKETKVYDNYFNVLITIIVLRCYKSLLDNESSHTMSHEYDEWNAMRLRMIS